MSELWSHKNSETTFEQKFSMVLRLWVVILSSSNVFNPKYQFYFIFSCSFLQHRVSLKLEAEHIQLRDEYTQDMEKIKKRNQKRLMEKIVNIIGFEWSNKD